MVIPATRPLLARIAAASLLLFLPLSGTAGAADPSTAADSRHRLDALRDAVEDAIPAASSKKANSALLSAREILLSGGRGLEPDTAALQTSSLLLERKVKDRPDLVVLAREALEGLLEDAAWETSSLSSRFDQGGGSRGPKLRALVDSRIELAGSLASSSPSRGARALRKAAKILRDLRIPRSPSYGGPLRVVSFEPATGALVGLNQPVTVRFSAPLVPSSVRPDTLQIRVGPNFQAQVPGTYEVAGNTVLFHPRLPTRADHMDSGFPPGVKIRVTTVGYPSTNAIMAKGRRTLDRTLNAEFNTASTGGLLYDFLLYRDLPPARLRESLPADVLPASPFPGPAGAEEVPTDVLPLLRLARVPLDPSTLAGRVRLVAVDLRGRPTAQEVPGTAEVEQDAAEVRLLFRPSVTLADRSRYALRIDPGVADLSGQFEMALHAGRSALASTAAAQVLAGGGPLADLAAAHPEAVDPRTYLLFTTREEPAADRLFFVVFDGTDPAVDGGDGSDPARTTASHNGTVPGSVAATVVAAGGDGGLGDFKPQTSTTLDTGSPQVAGGVFPFRRIEIRAGVTVTLIGPLPAVLRATEGMRIDGKIVATGSAGFPSESNYNTAALSIQPGGAGGPGGGAGGAASRNAAYSLPGDSGRSVPGGGYGGGGGFETGSGDLWSFGGGGGGGGHAVGGAAGGAGVWPSAVGYNGAGGSGGSSGGPLPSSAATEDGREFSATGGAGGGAGGNGHNTQYGWRTSGAGGGGGGGGLLLSSSRDIVIRGTVEARGGVGGASNPSANPYPGAPGGGGAGGTIALYTSANLDLAGALLDVSGGSSNVALGYSGAAGVGGDGFLRLESGTGGVTGLATAALLPDYTTGTFDPASAAGDPPSIFTGAWLDLGAMEPEILPFGPEHFVETAVPGCSLLYEIQMCGASPQDPAKPDSGALDPSTGQGTDPARASPWVPLKSTAGGILDPRPVLNGHGYRFFRLRITFTLDEGRRRSDGLPSVDEVRVPFRVQGG